MPVSGSAVEVLAFVDQFGVPVFPCRANARTPATSHGFKDATTSHDAVTAWARGSVNWGMPTGAASGFVVLDVDMKNGKDGLETLRALEARHGKLPETAVVLTPSGGFHYWFRPPEGVAIGSSADKLGSGLDIRGDGGYVCIPPSSIDGKAYTWEASSDPAEVGFAEFPAWMIYLLAKPTPRAAATNGEIRHIGAGGRNAHLTSLAGSMRRRDMSYAAILAALEVENAGRCDPPLEPDEVEKIAKSVSRYAPSSLSNPSDFSAPNHFRPPNDVSASGQTSEPRYANGRAEGTETPTPEQRATTEETSNIYQRASDGKAPELSERAKFLETPNSDERASRLQTPKAEERAHEPETPGHGQREASLWPRPLNLVELAGQTPSQPETIDGLGWLPVGYATLFSAHGGSGKSSVALHMMVCIALGIPFFGNPVKPRRVMYLSCEDRVRTLHWRLSRICAHLGIDLASLDGKLDILDLVGHEAVLWDRDPRTGQTMTMAYAVLRDRIVDAGIEVLTIDGVTDTFAGNENARSEAKRYVNALVSIMPEHGALLLIGHVAKLNAGAASDTSEGYSGSTGWHNACRARWYLRPDGEDRRTAEGMILELQKNNAGRSGSSINLKWDQEAHMFLGEFKQESLFDQKHRNQDEEDGVLLAIKNCTVPIPATYMGPRTAFSVLSQTPNFPKSLGPESDSKRRFWRIIERLRQYTYVEDTEYRRSQGHKGLRITLTTEGERRCASIL